MVEEEKCLQVFGRETFRKNIAGETMEQMGGC
jgi:hypothetical protein